MQEDVGPKREALAAANVKLVTATEKLGVVQRKLEALEVCVCAHARTSPASSECVFVCVCGGGAVAAVHAVPAPGASV